MLPSVQWELRPVPRFLLEGGDVDVAMLLPLSVLSSALPDFCLMSFAISDVLLPKDEDADGGGGDGDDKENTSNGLVR